MVRRDKTDYIGIRVTPEEKKAIFENAAALGLSVSAFLIGLAAGDKVGKMILDSRKQNKKD
ncbi:MAG: hypothetical protein HP044_06245 [Oscillospiraceae bacterium]|jgi:uncharacterized protein (DUF1778 family)|nr:hypothetical protein [Oscillospiraceae bacterium]